MKTHSRFLTRTLVVFAICLLCGCATNNHSAEGGNPTTITDIQSNAALPPGKSELEDNHRPEEGGNRKNANLIMLDSRINAANGHYKTVLITIADKQTNARITTSKSELEQLNSDLTHLEEDRRATEDQITGLAQVRQMRRRLSFFEVVESAIHWSFKWRNGLKLM